jgi:hypothetical protein
MVFIADKGEAGLEGWKFGAFGIAIADEEGVTGPPPVTGTPCPIGASMEETALSIDGRRLSHLRWPRAHKHRVAKSKNSDCGVWLLHCRTKEIRTDSVTARNWSWS